MGGFRLSEWLLGCPLGEVLGELLDRRQCSIGVEVTHRHNGHVLRGVPLLNILKNRILIKGSYGVIITDHRSAIGMFFIGKIHEFPDKLGPGYVQGAAILLQDNLLLPFQFVWIKNGMLDRIQQHVQAGPKVPTGDLHVIHCSIQSGVGIDAAPRGLDDLCDFAGLPSGGPFEDHVFDKVGDPGLSGGLIGTPGFYPDLDGCHRGTVILFYDHGETVCQLMPLGPCSNGGAVQGCGPCGPQHKSA